MNVQIDRELFLDLYAYFAEVDSSDYLAMELFQKLDEKLQKMISHELFTQYKRAATPEEREQARQKYLDNRGINKNFRTDKEIHGI